MCIVWKINERGEQGEHDDDDNAKMAKLNDVGSSFFIIISFIARGRTVKD